MRIEMAARRCKKERSKLISLLLCKATDPLLLIGPVSSWSVISLDEDSWTASVDWGVFSNIEQIMVWFVNCLLCSLLYISSCSPNSLATRHPTPAIAPVWRARYHLFYILFLGSWRCFWNLQKEPMKDVTTSMRSWRDDVLMERMQRENCASNRYDAPWVIVCNKPLHKK